jgi:photosystem II stability/assembly factor-like uncharacterized protein
MAMRFLRLWPLFASCLALAQTITPLSSNTSESLRGLSVVSRQVIWASGTHGTYLRSLDGGETWTAGQVPGGEGLDFRDVEAFSADEAYLLSAGTGELSRIYKTSDGGKTWNLQFTNEEPKGFYDCMAFWDSLHGIAIGDSVNGAFELIATEDGGAHWAPLPTPAQPRALPGEGSFAASGTCIAAQGTQDVFFVTGVNTARVFHSHNRGQTWSAADGPIMHDGTSAGIFSIAVGEAGFAVIAGGDYQSPDKDGVKLAFSEDGGMTWRPSPLTPQSFVSAVALDPTNKQTVLVVGSSHAGLAPDVRDSRWRMFQEVNLNAVAYAGSGLAFGVGPKGAVVRISIP